jgi:hypothetical protein
MPLLVNHKKKLIFVHIPKNGGCYCGDILTTYCNFEPFFEEYGKFLLFDENKNMNFKINEKYKDYSVLLVGNRNPYERFISGFFYVKNHDEDFNYDSVSQVINDENYFNTISRSYIHLFLLQSDFIKNISNKLYIIDFNNLSDDLERILKELQFDISYNSDVKYNKENKGDYKNNSEYIFDTFSLNFINKWFHNDFEFFNYTKKYNIETMVNEI